MCSEGGCCGPCCSARSWFVTHVVFVMLGTLSLVGYIAVFALLPAASSAMDTSSLSDKNMNLGDFGADLKTLSAATKDYGIAMTVTSSIALAFGVFWTVVGWITVCGNSEKAHLVYIVCCVVDFILKLIAVVLVAVYSGKISAAATGGPTNVFGGLNVFLYINFAIQVSLMDIAPVLCFFLCRAKTMSRYEDPTKM